MSLNNPIYNWNNNQQLGTSYGSPYTATYTATSPSYWNEQTNLIVNGALIVNGVDVAELLKTISERLCILNPDPERMKKFEQLQIMYEEYKLMEALCFEQNPES